MSSRSGESRAEQNRRIRQDKLREQLSNQKHIEHVVEIANKLTDLDKELDSLKIQRLKAAADIKKGLIGKYLPDLKQVDAMLQGPDGGAIDMTWKVEVKD